MLLSRLAAGQAGWLPLALNSTATISGLPIPLLPLGLCWSGRHALLGLSSRATGPRAAGRHLPGATLALLAFEGLSALAERG